jgi:Holliday junction resolvase RusA-like endonuclease
MSAEGKKIKEHFKKEFIKQWQSDPISGEIKLEVNYYWGDKRKRDIDNFSKLWLDAGTGIIWEDDNQISELLLKRNYDKNFPRIEIIIKK